MRNREDKMDIYDILKAHKVTDHCIADAIGSLLTGDIAKAEHALKRYRELNGTVCDVEQVVHTMVIPFTGKTP